MVYHRTYQILSAIFIVLLLVNSWRCRFDSNTDDLGDDYLIARGNGRGTLLCKKENISSSKIIIYDNIEDWKFNDTFIVVFRHITEEAKKLGKDDPFFQVQNNGDTLQYWIVNKDIDSIYGPFDKKEYFDKRLMLKVPDKLQLLPG